MTMLLKGGLVLDGEGNPPIAADVAIAGDRIAAVGPNLDVADAETIDASGRNNFV